jgi:pilus assembly protein Flp/PilA
MLSLATNVQIFGSSLINRLRDERGATAVEYGIMIALIAVVIIIAVTLLGGTVADLFGEVECKVGGGTTYTPVAGSPGEGTCA